MYFIKNIVKINVVILIMIRQYYSVPMLLAEIYFGCRLCSEMLYICGNDIIKLNIHVGHGKLHGSINK